MIDMTFHDVTEVTLTDPVPASSLNGGMAACLTITTRGGDAVQIDLCAKSVEALQVDEGHAESARRWQNVALEQTRRADWLEAELAELGRLAREAV